MCSGNKLQRQKKGPLKHRIKRGNGNEPQGQEGGQAQACSLEESAFLVILNYHVNNVV